MTRKELKNRTTRLLHLLLADIEQQVIKLDNNIDTPWINIGDIEEINFLGKKLKEIKND